MKKAPMFFCVVAGLGIMAQSVGAKHLAKGQRRGTQPKTVAIADPYKEAVDGILNAIAEKKEALARIDAAIEQEQAVAQALNSTKKSRGFDDLKPRDILKSAANISRSAVRQRKIKRDLVKSIKDLEKSLDLLGWEGPVLIPSGEWQAVDFVKEIEYFKPGKKQWTSDLYLKGLTFYKDGRTSGPWTWEKGWLWHPGDKTKARYIIKEIDGSSYLFMEWISGDVTIRRQKPRYYVMQKVVDNDTALSSGLIAYWKFDEGEGNTAYDSTGDHDGVVHGAQWTMGRIGGALSFDGVDNYVSCGSDASLDLTEFTWALWVKRTETNYSDERVLISANSLGESTTGTYSLQIDARGSRQNKVQFVKHAQSQMISQTPIADTNWHHVAVTRNGGGDVVIYIDGVADVSDNVGKRGAFDGILIGAGVKYYSNFKGFIDDVRIYNRALTVPEIKQLYGNLKIPNAAKGPVVYADGLAVDGIVVRQSDCTAQFVESLLGKPRKKDGSMLRYTDSGIDFCVPRNGSLSEIHLNRGFKGKLDSGISLTSTKQDVFRAYGEPVEIIRTANLHQAKGERVLRQNGNVSRIYYGNEGLIFWFRDDSVIQIVVFKGRMKRSDSNPILSDSLVGHWKFDGDADDSVGANDGDIHGAQSTDGVFGGALVFDGQDDYVEIAGYKGITGSNARTCTAWIRAMNTNDAYYSIMSWGNDNTGSCWYIALNGRGDRGNMGALRLMVVGGSICGTTNLRDGRWHHVAVVLPDDGAVDVSDALLYVDGLPEKIIYSKACEINTGDTEEDVSRNDVLIGKFYRTGTGEGYSFGGLIDDVRIYDRALDSDEVASLADVDTSLVAHWTFDDNLNDYALDNDGIGHQMGTGVTYVDGIFGKACDFNGVGNWHGVEPSSFIEIDGSGTYNEYSISVWFKTGNDNYRPFFSDAHGAGAHTHGRPEMGTYGGKVYVVGSDTGLPGPELRLFSSSGYGDDQWHHAVGIGDSISNVVELYVDGKYVGLNGLGDVYPLILDNGGTPDTRCEIGGRSRKNKYYVGQVDDVRIYSGKISASKVRQLYAAGSR